jgi:hypothetical protein
MTPKLLKPTGNCTLRYWNTLHKILSDYQLFDSLKDIRRGHQFASDKAVKELMHARLATGQKHFFVSGHTEACSLFTNKCLEKHKGYIYKKYFLTRFLLHYFSEICCRYFLTHPRVKVQWQAMCRTFILSIPVCVLSSLYKIIKPSSHTTCSFFFNS